MAENSSAKQRQFQTCVYDFVSFKKQLIIFKFFTDMTLIRQLKEPKKVMSITVEISIVESIFHNTNGNYGFTCSRSYI